MDLSEPQYVNYIVSRPGCYFNEHRQKWEINSQAQASLDEITGFGLGRLLIC